MLYIPVSSLAVRRLQKGEIVQPTDFYRSTSCTWLVVPAHGFEAPDPDLSESVTYVRSLAADESKKQEKKWPPIDYGSKVRVTVGDNISKDWTPKALYKRKGPGIYEGTVVGHSDLHGLCHKVKFEDGTISFYDDFEVEEIE